MHIVSDLTFILVELLEKGVLDFLIGVNPNVRNDCSVEKIFDDQLYMIVPKDVAREHSGHDQETDLASFKDIPFIRDVSSNASVSIIDQYLAHRHVYINNIVEINNEEVRAELCGRLKAGMFCSGSFAFFRESYLKKMGLEILALKGLRHSVSICLVSSEARAYPTYVSDMMDITRDYLKGFYGKFLVHD